MTDLVSLMSRLVGAQGRVRCRGWMRWYRGRGWWRSGGCFSSNFTWIWGRGRGVREGRVGAGGGQYDVACCVRGGGAVRGAVRGAEGSTSVDAYSYSRVRMRMRGPVEHGGRRRGTDALGIGHRDLHVRSPGSHWLRLLARKDVGVFFTRGRRMHGVHSPRGGVRAEVGYVYPARVHLRALDYSITDVERATGGKKALSVDKERGGDEGADFACTACSSSARRWWMRADQDTETEVLVSRRQRAAELVETVGRRGGDGRAFFLTGISGGRAWGRWSARLRRSRRVGTEYLLGGVFVLILASSSGGIRRLPISLAQGSCARRVGVGLHERQQGEGDEGRPRENVMLWLAEVTNSVEQLEACAGARRVAAGTGVENGMLSVPGEVMGLGLMRTYGRAHGG
ncbi:hypothetical protein B0H16DRAFT_1837819 [Mycena metata]|uniref:Uncharacterized protein n=1 Tax=Mycena metata TaxID=1033252 RepID=A0AAD7DSS1_9AGAR|nr:hypothetical protein B0H16DRAFT_1837819 [Mycena metata]